MSALLHRIVMATVTAPDLDRAIEDYRRWLGFTSVERGQVDADLAALWGTPAMAGRRVAVLESADRTGLLRFVEADPIPGYTPMASWGWNAIEILVRDPLELHRALGESPFMIVGKPLPLRRFPHIVALQVRGTSDEILYLTADTATGDARVLPLADADVSCTFIMVLAGSDHPAACDYYARHFGIIMPPATGSPTAVLQDAQALPRSHLFPMSFARLGAPGYSLQIDGYPASTGPRARRHGQLPPGIASATFDVADLDALDVPFLAPPRAMPQPGYDGCRVAATIGAADELIELVERPG